MFWLQTSAQYKTEPKFDEAYSSGNKIKVRDCPVLSLLLLVTLTSDIAMSEPCITHTIPRNATLNIDLIYLILVICSVTRSAFLVLFFFQDTADHHVNNCVLCMAFVLKTHKLLSALLLLCMKPFPHFYFFLPLSGA